MIYLASPYYHPDALIMKTRYLLARQATIGLLSQEKWVYSPVVHNHVLEMDRDHAFWMRFDFDMLRRCESLAVLYIAGWDESKGVSMEIEMASRLGMRIAFVNEHGDFLDGSNY